MSRYLPAGLLVALVVVGVSAAAMSQPAPLVSGVDDSTAGIQEPQAPQALDGSSSSSQSHAPTSTKQLRWRVAWAAEGIGAHPVVCATIVSVRNLSPAALDVDVEWFAGNAVTKSLRTLSIASQESREFVTDTAIDLSPFVQNDDADLTAFEGFAEVFADDPRIQATAYLLCRGNTESGFSINTIPTFPMGATLEFFQAGMPATWMTPVATPDVPE